MSRLHDVATDDKGARKSVLQHAVRARDQEQQQE
jgi:hypothetical protein